eukprot:TRINITY_DN1998_c0_g2_i2.p2 TRINITY_DN1998_c0_g2~~TRINITY_DN1998_c0_g2_i2.p2  ORF type:complete len:209 (+),score=8.62 TRINITY_DN1998_c0_g2_i2:107-733(+)
MILIFSISILALCLTAETKWTEPIQLLDISHSYSVVVWSVYRDPVSSLNHVLVSENNEVQYLHFALTDDGTVVSKSEFHDPGYGLAGVVKGANNGKNLFMALWSYMPGKRSAINFTESSNSGETWSKAQSIALSSTDRWLQDMVYIRETGRLFVFFIDQDFTLRMVTRSPGSSVFSKDLVIAEDALPNVQHAKVVYCTYYKCCSYQKL